MFNIDIFFQYAEIINLLKMLSRLKYSEAHVEADAVDGEPGNITRDGTSAVWWHSALPAILRLTRTPPPAAHAPRTLLTHRQQ